MGFFEVVGIASILPFMKLIAEPNAINRTEALRWAYGFFGFESHRAMLIATGVGVILTITISNILGVMTMWFQYKFSWTIAHNLTTRLLRTYLNKPYSFYLKTNTSELRAYLISEVGMLTGGVIIPIIELISRGIVSFVIFGLLVYIDPQIAFTMLFVLGGAYWLIYVSRQGFLKRLGERRIAANKGRYSNLAEVLDGIKTVKVYGSQSFFYDRYERTSREFCEVQPKVNIVMKSPKYILEIFAFGGILGVTLYLFINSGNFQEVLPVLSLYAVAGYRLLPALQKAFASTSKLKHNAPILEKLHPDLKNSLKYTEPEIKIANTISFKEKITLQNIHFQYDNIPQDVLTNINLNIKKGEIVAFVGSTGSGKTTLIDLIVGLLYPTKGAIKIDNTTLSKSQIPNWQQHIAYVPQEVFLFDDTIARNIVFGQKGEEIDYEKLTAVTQMADIFDFINKELPDGFQTKIGERGVRLSGGQRQRLGLARALYRDPSILVLDEATSALDNITERGVIDSLKALPDDLTVIIIAHRLSTVRHANCIYLLNQGQIVAQDSYNNLIKSNATFQEMAHLS